MIDASPAPDVSAIICTRDRPRDLARCLPTVLDNDHPNFEVVVVDQSRTEASEEVVRAAAEAAGWAFAANGEAPPEGPTVVYKRTSTVGLDPARNEGVRLARAEVLAFTDDDCTPDQRWLSSGAFALSAVPDAGVLFGKFAPIPHNYRTTYVPYFLPSRPETLRGPEAPLHCPAVAGANMFVRREAYERVSGFDECLGPGTPFRGGDDDDFAYRVLQAGYAGLISPETQVLHWGAREYADGSGQRLLRDYYEGLGARLIKQVRCRDKLAARDLVSKVNTAWWFFVGNVVAERRLTGAGRLGAMFSGMIRGLGHPIDRERRLFVPRYGNGRR
jgi:GT2 family glycosyltransferase